MAPSLKETVAGMTPERRIRFVRSMPPETLAEMLKGAWWWTSRPEQVPPPGEWLIYLILSGRGFGKTRSGSEWIVERAMKHPVDSSGAPTERLVIGETISDTRTILLGGPSGIIRVLEREGIAYHYTKSPKPQIIIKETGSIIHAAGAETADVGRGFNLADVWMDEMCIAKGQLIATKRGRVKVPVEKIREGDQVLTRDGYKRVLHAWKSGSNVPTALIKCSGRELRCTFNQKLLTDRGWKKVEELNLNDIIHLQGRRKGNWVRRPLDSIGYSPSSDVYDLEVEDAHEFVASGFVVHNCKWPHPRESWFEGIMPALRASLPGDHPRAYVTTTPKPMPILREWVSRDDGSVIVVRGSTFDNATNLSPLILEALKKEYDGTSIGRQELYGELLDDMVGKLFSQTDINMSRVNKAPDLQRVVVSVDPGLTGEDDETGIVVVGADKAGDWYVLADLSAKGVGREAAMKVWRAFIEHKADKVVVETNLGKKWMIESFTSAYTELVRDVDNPLILPPMTSPPIAQVDAKVGKLLRAQPVGMRCEQGRLHFVGTFPVLEAQCVDYDPNDRESPDRLDALVHGCRYHLGMEKKAVSISSAVSLEEKRLGQNTPTGMGGMFGYPGMAPQGMDVWP
jgi:phage terminase large subunit-like protein